MKTAKLSPDTEVAVWLRILHPDGEITPKVARALLQLSFPASDVERMHELSAKARDGTLTPDEDRAMDEYERVGALLAAALHPTGGRTVFVWQRIVRQPVFAEVFRVEVRTRHRQVEPFIGQDVLAQPFPGLVILRCPWPYGPGCFATDRPPRIGHAPPRRVPARRLFLA
jgi:hypothetical protein